MSLDTNNPAPEKMGRSKKTGALVAHARIGYCRRSQRLVCIEVMGI